ncbi:MAG TPA: PSD1 and planctomycete cytochrome C domain-containing protein [Planctomycetaceae bacterium]|nr:PSD1 and planctomycete cytochrome C domain-containing protein [Planctomycetaceae bacterium]
MGIWSVAIISQAADDPAHLEFFEREVRPLLFNKCGKCHGAAKQWAELRLDSRVAMLKGGEHGPAIIPGKPDESRLIEAVRQTGDVQMPPDGKLTEAQIAALERWIKLGAPWPNSPLAAESDRARIARTHWAFQPVKDVVPPQVADAAWTRTPVDQFVLARLTANELAPSPPADRRTLIRRVRYDLTGLPPTPADVEAFVKDPDPDAYAKLVERLLDSPQYGEQQARHWLDVARYSDTKGYVYGREERVWVHAPTYRDWVVQAFNRDLPYDRFLLLQIAADRAAPDDPSALAAMGFLTLGRRFLGVTHDIIDDRIDVVTRGTMGLTVACARCHDHKYDPIPTADYYALYGVFLNSTERLLPVAEPTTRDDAFTAFEKELDARQTKLRQTTAAKRREAADRVRQRVTEYLVAQTELDRYPEEGFDQVLAATDVIPTFVRRWEAYLLPAAKTGDPFFVPWHRLAQLSTEEFSQRSPEIIAELATTETIPARLRQALAPPPMTMRDVAERYGRVLADVERDWQMQLAAAVDADLPEPEALADAEAEALRQILYSPASPCLVPDEAVVSTESWFDTNSLNELWKLQGEVDRWLIQSPLAPPHSVALVDRALIRPAYVFRRGNPKTRGDEVARHFPSVVAGPNPSPFSTGSGRWELAKAIMDPANPLTARVWANRIWQHHFGNGLVTTPSDFGVRAEPPSHPELLDWLATQLVQSGWSTKALHRLIVLSNAYQQRSDGPTDAAARQRALLVDPDNRLLWRMNPRRLSFEEFRDTLLMTTGRLDPKPGGRAAELFAGNGTTNRRRTLYGLVDRQFLPTTLRMFDFANPDLHTPQRSETTVPQQALFALNHPMMAEHAKALVTQARLAETDDPAEKARHLYRSVYQREPTERQIQQALAFIAAAVSEPESTPRPETLAWQYGYGELDETTKQLKGFARLPYFTGAAWQGAAQWPGGGLGWLQLTAHGGHTGDDLKHSVVRRWTVPRNGTYSVASTAIHEVAAGDGVRCYIVSSRDGLLKSTALHNRKEPMNVDTVTLQAGDTLDFIVDLNANLNSEQHLWAPVITEMAASATGSDATPSGRWDAERDFAGPTPVLLSRWEQLAQVLLASNELMFVD